MLDDKQMHGNAVLAKACERALFARARSAGTRQMVRAAARAFVRRHRRDEGHLRWVLRGVGASSALAVTLLGLAGAPAAADTAPFVLRATNLDPQDAGTRSAPALGDLDRDGDLDLVCGTETGRFRFFQNVGSATSPSFARGFGGGNPLDGEDVGDRAAPAAADLDGDADLVTGSLAGTFALHYFPEPARALLLGASAALLACLDRLRRRVR